MKYLFINSVCGIRSTGRIVTDLADDFIKKGHTCAIAYGREDAPDKYKAISYRIGTAFNIKVNALKARIFDNEAFNAKKQTKKFIKWANDYNPDVLWLHNLHGYYINIDLLFRWIKSRPQMEVRWTLHDCWSFTGHCSHFDFVGCNRWKTECFGCPEKKEYPKSFLFDNSKKNYQRKKNLFCGVKDMTLITPSKWLADLVKKSFLAEYDVEIVHNKIDAEIFVPTNSDFRDKHSLNDKFIILGVASAWTQRKGMEDFLKLSELLDSSYAIVMVGLTKAQIKTMPNNILCIEKTNSKKELAEIYTAADVFLNLTYEDTYPTVNLESQACGAICLTYRTGGSVESVGVENIVERGDIFSIVKKLEELKAKKQ